MYHAAQGYSSHHILERVRIFQARPSREIVLRHAERFHERVLKCHSRSLCGVRTLWLFAWRCRQMARRNFVCAYFGAYLVQRTSDHKRQYFSCEMRKSHTADALGRSYVRNPTNGYVSMQLLIDEANGNEFTVR